MIQFIARMADAVDAPFRAICLGLVLLEGIALIWFGQLQPGQIISSIALMVSLGLAAKYGVQPAPELKTRRLIAAALGIVAICIEVSLYLLRTSPHQEPQSLVWAGFISLFLFFGAASNTKRV